MTVEIIDEQRAELIKLLPEGWSQIIEDRYLEEEFQPCTVWPDQADIMAGTKTAAKKALKKYGFVTPEILKLLA